LGLRAGDGLHGTPRVAESHAVSFGRLSWVAIHDARSLRASNLGVPAAAVQTLSWSPGSDGSLEVQVELADHRVPQPLASTAVVAHVL